MRRLLALLVVLSLLAPVPVRADDSDTALKGIQGLLQDANPEIRASAVRGLAKFAKDQATPLLLPVLDKDAAIEVTMACIELLGDLREEKAVPNLLKIFDRRVRDDSPIFGVMTDLDQKIHDTEQAIQKAKKPEEQNKLKEELKNLQKAREVRRESGQRLAVVFLLAIEAMGKIGAKEAIPKLVLLALNDSPVVRYAALGALGGINDASVRPALEKYLTTGNGDQRLRALQGLEDLAMIAKPGTEDPWVRKAIARMVVTDMENSDRAVAGQALSWAMDLGTTDGTAISYLPRIMGYRDQLRASDSDNRFLPDFELLSLYLRHKVARQALRPPPLPAPAPTGATVETH